MRERTIARVLLTCVAAFACLAPAHAQYKWVDAGGGIHYGDRLPMGYYRLLEGPNGPVASSGAGELPYSLKQTAGRFPVVLYTTTDCEPCKPAREHLRRRGIPHQEKLVRSDSEADAFRRLGFGEVGFPSLSVGGQRSVGYEVGTWDRMLSAAGYPKRSLLPRAYKQSGPTPLLAATRGTGKATEKSSDRGGAGKVASNNRSPQVDVLNAQERFRF